MQYLSKNLNTFILMCMLATSCFAGRSENEILEANIDKVVIGGCGAEAPYGIKHGPRTLTINLDQEADADFTLDAFTYNEAFHPWLEKHFKGKIHSVVVEHIGESLVNVSSETSMPTWFKTDPLPGDQQISQSLYFTSGKDFSEEWERTSLLLNNLTCKFLTSKEEQEKRPNLMKVLNTYKGLLAKNGDFEWLSGVFNEGEQTGVFSIELLNAHKNFFEKALDLTDVVARTDSVNEGYKILMKPADYNNFGKEYDHLPKYHVSVKGLVK